MKMNPDVKKRLRSVEEACPLTTAAEANAQGENFDLVPCMANTQMEQDDQWCDTRICRLCKCSGETKFQDYAQEWLHRQADEHKKRVKEYKEDHWRCIVCGDGYQDKGRHVDSPEDSKA